MCPGIRRTTVDYSLSDTVPPSLQTLDIPEIRSMERDARDTDRTSVPLTELMGKWRKQPPSSSTLAAVPGLLDADLSSARGNEGDATHGALAGAVDVFYDRFNAWFPPPVHISPIPFRVAGMVLSIIALLSMWPSIQRQRQQHASSTDARRRGRWMAMTLVTVVVIGFVSETGWKEAYHMYCVRSNLQHAGNVYWLKRYATAIHPTPLV